MPNSRWHWRTRRCWSPRPSRSCPMYPAPRSVTNLAATANEPPAAPTQVSVHTGGVDGAADAARCARSRHKPDCRGTGRRRYPIGGDSEVMGCDCDFDRRDRGVGSQVDRRHGFVAVVHHVSTRHGCCSGRKFRRQTDGSRPNCDHKAAQNGDYQRRSPSKHLRNSAHLAPSPVGALAVLGRVNGQMQEGAVDEVGPQFGSRSVSHTFQARPGPTPAST